MTNLKLIIVIWNLEETLKGKDIIKEFIRKGGLRCEILISGTIKLGDEIKTI